MICFSDCFLMILVDFPQSSGTFPLEYLPINYLPNMGQVGWFLSHYSHPHFLPHVLHRKHGKTLARPFKDFDMMILEPLLHDMGDIFWIIVWLILPAEVLFEFLLRKFLHFFKNLEDVFHF